jgi:hypothetical protein
MTKTRLLAVRIAGVVAGLVLPLLVVAPVAHADSLQDLQDIAFAEADYIPAPPATVDGLKGSYNGDTRVFRGDGDPMDDALTKAYQAGAGGLIGNCDWTEYGVSFRRNENYDPEDIVGIVMGKPNSAPKQQTPADFESPTVPVGQECKPKPPVPCPPGGPKTEVPAGEKCPAPVNAIKVSFDRRLGTWGVNVTNSAGIVR